MTERHYSRELSSNSANIALLLTAVISGIIGVPTFLVVITNQDTKLILLLLCVASIIFINISRKLIQRDKVETGIQIFLLSHILIIAIAINQYWVPGSPLPYLFSLLIIISGVTHTATYPFTAWTISSVLLILAVSQTSSETPFRDSIIPITINFLTAAFTFSLLNEWYFAVNSISVLHTKTRARRDELFSIQEELKWANTKLENLNKEIDQARGEADTANMAKTTFLSNMSHELRTPLNAILNFTWFVLDEMHGPINGEQKNALQEVMDSSEHLLSLINDVLDLNKIEAGMVNLLFEKIEIEKPLRSMVSIGTGLVKDKPIELIVNIPENLPSIKGDRRRLRQIFLNLISNAIKYTEKGQVTIFSEQRENMIHISVKDSGIGIAQEDYDLVFETYRQAQHNPGNVVSTGLGLPITKQLVELHGGQIWFESELNKGSTFHICLPIVPEEVLVNA